MANESADTSPLPGFPEAVQDRRNALDQAVSFPDHAITVEDEHVGLETIEQKQQQSTTNLKQREQQKQQKRAQVKDEK